MKRLRFYSIFRVGVSPLHGSCRFVVMANISHQFQTQIGEGAKDTASNDVTLDFGEPVFHLIQPRGIGWRIMDLDIVVCLKEGCYKFRFVRREVVRNDMDFFASGLGGNDFFQETHELGAGMAFCSLAKNFSAPGFQSRIERKRAVAKVFKTMRFSSSGRQRQDGIKAIQSLDGALFINAKDRSIRRRVKVETNDVRSLGFKVRIITDHMVTDAVGLQPIATPDPGHSHVGSSQLLSQASAAPLRGAIIRSTPRPLQNTSFQFRGILGCRPPLMTCNQTRDTAFQKAPPPTLDVGGAAPYGRRYRSNTRSRSQLKDHVGTLGIFSSNGARANSPVQLSTLRWTYHNAFALHSSKVTLSVSDIKVTVH